MTKLTYLFLACCLCLSFLTLAEDDPAPDDPPAPPPAQPANQPEPPAVDRPKPRSYYYQSDVDRYFNPDEVKKLLAGDTEVYALFQDDMTGHPKGVALLLPDWSQSASSSRGIEFLRTHLPDYGWVTLSMAVPDSAEQVYTTSLQPGKDAPNRPDKPMRPEPLRFVDEQYMQQYQLQFKMRMQALLNEAQNYPGYVIVFAQGSSAAVLSSLYAQGELPEPEALILLSAALADKRLNDKMNIDIAKTSIPTLDVYQTRGYRWVKENIEQRRKLVRKYYKASYRATELFGDISYHNQNHRLLKTVYGWLSSVGL